MNPVRRHQQAARAGQGRDAVGRADAFGRFERVEQLDQFLGTVGGLFPGVGVRVGRYRKVLRPPHRGEKPAESGTRFGGLEVRESAVFVVIGVEQMGVVASCASRKDVAPHDGLLPAGANADA